jgi:hypothetical protein
MIDLTTRYLGFTLKNPLVASAAPLCESLDNIRSLRITALPPWCWRRCLKSN